MIPADDDRPVPGIPARQQPPDCVRRAYWAAIALANTGWRLLRMEWHAGAAVAVVRALSPAGRSVILTSCGQTPSRMPGAQPLAGLAAAIAAIGTDRRGAGRVEELCWLVQAHTAVVGRARACCADVLPGLGEQPPRPARVAAWLIAHLVNESGWHVHSFGLDVAAGGFIADVPGEVLAVFPASMPDDGTPASALARLLGQLSMAELRLLATLDYRELYAARRGAP